MSKLLLFAIIGALCAGSYWLGNLQGTKQNSDVHNDKNYIESLKNNDSNLPAADTDATTKKTKTATIKYFPRPLVRF